ncbi:hypothetical protein D3C86_2007470 [compost metagenome]
MITLQSSVIDLLLCLSTSRYIGQFRLSNIRIILPIIDGIDRITKLRIIQIHIHLIEAQTMVWIKTIVDFIM